MKHSQKVNISWFINNNKLIQTIRYGENLLCRHRNGGTSKATMKIGNGKQLGLNWVSHPYIVTNVNGHGGANIWYNKANCNELEY